MQHGGQLRAIATNTTSALEQRASERTGRGGTHTRTGRDKDAAGAGAAAGGGAVVREGGRGE